MVSGRDAMRGTTIRAAAARHGFGEAAVDALWHALERGGGRMAQFSHPELGGMGQWSAGGLVQIGAMFDDRLKARVAAACHDLAAAMAEGDASGRDESTKPGEAAADGPVWWPGGLGQPSASGAQNGLRYAYFAERRRLAIARDGRVTLYDTGRHRIFGVSQRQSRGPHLAFTADDGTVDVDSLAVVPS